VTPTDALAVNLAEDNASERPARRLLLGLALALITLVAYLPSLQNGFVDYDDKQYITENPIVQAGWTIAGFRWAASSNAMVMWHPLTLISHMTDCQLFGLNPKGHHLTSLLIHLAVVLLLFRVFDRMTGSPLRSAAVALLFAVHPLHVESVAWVAERKDVLCGLFWVLTIGAYLRYVRRPSLLAYLLVFGSDVLALLAKPMAVTLPAVLLLLDLWPLQRGGDFRRWRFLVFEKLPLVLATFLAALMSLHTQADAMAGSVVATTGLRIGNALTSYVSYLGKTFWPLRLAVFYPFPDHIAPWRVAGAVALLGLVTGAAVALRRRAPYFLVGWLWYLGVLVPVVGFVQVGLQSMADRYSYLPSIGLNLAIVWGLADLGRAVLGDRMRRWAGAALGATTLALVLLTRVQVGTWSDFMTLFTHALEVQESYLAHTNIAEGLRTRAESMSEPERTAVRRLSWEHYRAALTLAPGDPQAFAAAGSALRAWGKPQAAQPYLQGALRLSPDDEPARVTLAMTDDDLGRPDAAIAELRLVVAQHPRSGRGHFGLGSLLARTGDMDGALREFVMALEDDPGLLSLYGPTATLLAQRGRLDEALKLLGKGIELQPHSGALHAERASILERMGRLEEAKRDRHEAEASP
jgi:tetratricopeptide (TPR) repeat protein